MADSHGRHILDDDGKPVEEPDLLRWAAWFEKANRQVAKTQIGDVLVSTVFLGVDHAFGHGLPLLYETMIFGGEHEGHQERYPSRLEAAAGHVKAVRLAEAAAQESPNA